MESNRQFRSAHNERNKSWVVSFYKAKTITCNMCSSECKQAFNWINDTFMLPMNFTEIDIYIQARVVSKTYKLNVYGLDSAINCIHAFTPHPSLSCAYMWWNSSQYIAVVVVKRPSLLTSRSVAPPPLRPSLPPPFHNVYSSFSLLPFLISS